jgi:hypothetical protein
VHQRFFIGKVVNLYMGKKFFAIIIIFAALFSFRVADSDFLQIVNSFSSNSVVFEQNSEEDCAILNIISISKISLILPIMISDCDSPSIRVSEIWKPPVNT